MTSTTLLALYDAALLSGDDDRAEQLGRFAADVEDGRMTEAEALEVLASVV